MIYWVGIEDEGDEVHFWFFQYKVKETYSFDRGTVEFSSLDTASLRYTEKKSYFFLIIPSL